MGRWTRRILVGLAVIVVLFFAQRVVFPGEGRDGERVEFQALLGQIDRGQVERVTLEAANDTAEVKLAGGPDAVDMPYPDGYEEALVKLLVKARVPLEIEGHPPWWFGLLVYYGPFAAFWIWLARRLPRRPRRQAEGTPNST